MESSTATYIPAVTSSTKRASYVSLLVGILLLGVKFWAYRITNSQAVFSDAMESIVNVVAAGLTLWVTIIAARPADKDHPYGHGKVEFFSAAFEGGLVAFAAALICVEATRAIIHGHSLSRVGIGIGVVFGAGLGNLFLGLYLLYTGKKSNSIALIASGQHVISDFWTTVGVASGLILVRITGLKWLDPMCALLVGLYLAFTGFKLVRRSIGGLLDEEDREILSKLLAVLIAQQRAGIIQVHHTRVIRSGGYHHIDAHVVVPEFWDISRAHQETEDYENRVIKDYPFDGELHFHVDPCRKAYCGYCDVENCPIRTAEFKERRVLSIDELTNPEEPSHFRA